MELVFRLPMHGRTMQAALERALAAWARGHRRRTWRTAPQPDQRAVLIEVIAFEPRNDVVRDLRSCLQRGGIPEPLVEAPRAA